jgi:hypothetical protein
MYIEQPHIKVWLERGYAKRISTDVATSFGDYLNSLPWGLSGTQLNWLALPPHKTLKLDALLTSANRDWDATKMGQNECVVFWFAPGQPCIACSSHFAMSRIDEAYWKAPGRRYMFAGSFSGEIFSPIFENFAEYDGSETVRVI